MHVAVGSERSFGLTFAVVFTLLAGVSLWKGGSAWLALLPAAAVFLLTGLFASRVLRPFNRLWHAFGMLLGRVTTPVVMAAVFCTTVVPIGLAMRAAGRDLLRLRWDRTARSYWIAREPAGPEPQSMKQQF